MTEPGPAEPGTSPPPRPGFARLLRANLPASPLDVLGYAAAAAALRFFLNLPVTEAVAITAGAAVATVLGLALSGYAAARLLPPRGAGDDDDAVSGDG